MISKSEATTDHGIYVNPVATATITVQDITFNFNENDALPVNTDIDAKSKQILKNFTFNDVGRGFKTLVNSTAANVSIGENLVIQGVEDACLWVADSGSFKVGANATVDETITFYNGTFTIDAGKTLTVAEGAEIDIRADAALDIKGTVNGALELSNDDDSVSTVTIQKDGIYSGTIAHGDSEISVSNIKAASTITIKAGSIEFSGAVAEVSGSSIIIVSGNAVVNENFTIAKGTTLTVAAGATLEVGESNTLTVAAGATLNVAGELSTGSNATIANSGTVASVNGGNLNGATISNTSTGTVTEVEDDSDMENISITGIIKGTANNYDANQLVTVIGDTTMAENSKLTIYGKLYIPAGVTLTLEAGAELVLDNNAALQIEGSIVVKEDDTVNGNAAISVDNGSVFVYGDMTVQGILDLTKGSVAVKADGVLTIAETGVFTAGTDGTSVKVEASGAMYVIGSLGEMTVVDNGTVVFDSEVASGNVEIQLGNGATVEIVSIAMENGGKLTVYDVDSDGDVQNEIKIAAATTGSATGSGYIAAVIGGIEITDVATTASSVTTYKMYISGEATVSAVYVTDGAEDEPTMTATATITLTGSTADKQGVVISEDLTVGENVTLDNDGALEVTADVDATEGTFTQSGKIDVTGEGSIVVKSKIVAEDGINATMYKTGSTTSDTRYTYVTLDAALAVAAAGTSADLTVLGTQTLYESAVVPADVKLTLTGATVLIGEEADDTGVTLTVEDGASVKGTPAKVTVNGTIYAIDKTDVDTAARSAFYDGSSVYTEELNEKGQAVRDGWAKWTNITAALADAEDYSVVKITQAIVIKADTTIPETVTLDTNNYKISIDAGATLTVNGTLYLNNGSGDSTLTLIKKTTSGTDTYGAIVLNGDIESDEDVSEMVKKDTSEYVIPGAYYSITVSGVTAYYATTVALAAPVISLVDDQTVTLRGAELTVGDVTFEGESSTAMATVNVEADKLTASSIALSDAKLDLKDAQFEGTVEDASGSVALKGTSSSLTATSTDKFTLAGSFTTTKFEVTGTAYTSGLTATPVKVSGTLNLGGSNSLTTIEVTGTLAVQKSATLTATKATVTGTLSVADDAGAVTITKLFVGITEDYALKATAASAAVSGKVTVLNFAIVAPGSTVPESITDLDSTVFYIENAVYVTAYAGASIDTTIGSVNGHIDNALSLGWVDEDGNDADSKNFGEVSKVTADIQYDIYLIVIKADTGIGDLYLNGNIMQKGQITVEATSTTPAYTYSAYWALVSAGTYEVTCKLTNGYDGTATLKDLKGTAVSGNKITVSGTPEDELDVPIEFQYQLTGIEKSGYVDPVEPVKEDNGLKVTDYLLIVLVILVVVLAVIVAMRLMRS